MRVVNLSKILAPYVDKGLWVAMNNEETQVLATARTLEAAVKKAAKLGEACPVVMKPSSRMRI